MAEIREDIGLSYDDVLLVPKHGVLQHRKDADITSKLVEEFPLRIPFVSAPMSSVTEAAMARAMWQQGGIGVLHRFYDSAEEQARHLDNNSAVAIGIKTSIRDIDLFIDRGALAFVLDVAHADTDSVGSYVYDLRTAYPKGSISLIVGNIATAHAARFLVDLEVDGVKVGIGPGAACSTRTVTGFGVPQLTAVMDVYQEIQGEATIIADGGIKTSGDIVKALAAGADTVMLGRLLAGCDEAPEPGKYWGMASSRVNGHRAPEGVEGTVPLTGSVEATLKRLAWGVRSGVSYAGARNLEELRDNAEFIRVAPGVQAESAVRI